MLKATFIAEHVSFQANNYYYARREVCFFYFVPRLKTHIHIREQPSAVDNYTMEWQFFRTAILVWVYHDQTCSCSGYCVGIQYIYTQGRKGCALSYIAVYRNRLRSPLLSYINVHIYMCVSLYAQLLYIYIIC